MQELNYTQHKQQRVNKNGGGVMNGVYYILCMFFYYSIFRFKWLDVYTKIQIIFWSVDISTRSNIIENVFLTILIEGV